jgi:hypothetical protein
MDSNADLKSPPNLEMSNGIVRDTPFEGAVRAMLWLEGFKVGGDCRYKDLPPTYSFSGDSDLVENVGISFDPEMKVWVVAAVDQEFYDWMFHCRWASVYIEKNELVFVSKPIPVPDDQLVDDEYGTSTVTPKFSVRIACDAQVLDAISAQQKIKFGLCSIVNGREYILSVVSSSSVRVIPRADIF